MWVNFSAYDFSKLSKLKLFVSNQNLIDFKYLYKYDKKLLF